MKTKGIVLRVVKATGFLLLIIITIAAALLITVYRTLELFCEGPSPTARELFVTTFLETGSFKFVVPMLLDSNEIEEIVNKNSMEIIESDVKPELIEIAASAPASGSTDDQVPFDPDGMELVTISGRTFYAKMLIINDPSRVTLSTTYPWTDVGMDLKEHVEKNDAIAGVNGGLYYSIGNKGGHPYGVAVSNGEIQYNDPQAWPGLYMVGFDNNDILRIVNIANMTAEELEQYIIDEGIRDAVAFQEEYSDANNHFVQLIINGEPRVVEGLGSGANPRTAIGQRADGAVLLLVTDGRGASGNLGATAADLIKIMSDYGAVNAANIDGGSSSAMYVDGKYEMTSVTFYYSNSSWLLPTCFIVSRR